MKKTVSIALFLVITSVAFSQKATKLNIVYFHAEHRCPTCLSIEENTKKTWIPILRHNPKMVQLNSRCWMSLKKRI